MEFREARRADVPAILDLLADDEVSRDRGYGTVPEEWDAGVWAAFEEIAASAENELVVAEQDGVIVGTCQLTFTPGLSRGGMRRMTIEAVRVRSGLRGQGIGKQLMVYAVERARDRGCGLVQLTTDKRRAQAHLFYAGLGFVDSHVGMKLAL